MTIAACAAMVERGDPDRFLATMAAPPALRAHLFPLYAFNLEVARAPWVTQEVLIAEMRLQWWRDALAGPRRAHEVAGPLHDTIRATGLPVAVLDRLVAARRQDIARGGFADAAAFWAYLDDTAGGLMWVAACACGAPAALEPAARAAGRAAGLAHFLCALPELAARGQDPLPPGIDVAALARDGLSMRDAARGARSPALLAAWLAAPVLRRAARDPAAVAAGALRPSEFRRRGGLVWAAATGRW